MNSSTPNAERHRHEEIPQSIEETPEPRETPDPQTPSDEPDMDGGDNSNAEVNSSDEEDSDDEEETNSAVARRFVRSRAPSPEEPSLRVHSDNGTRNSRRRDGGAPTSSPDSAPYVSPPRSTIATGTRLAPSPSPQNAGIPPRGPSADADGPPCDPAPDAGSGSGRTDA